MQEHGTAAWVEARLDELGIEHERVGGTGVVGILRHPDATDGPVIAYRADTDALPMKEDSGVEYESTARGTLPDGTDVPVMHACGHDSHVAMAVTAAHVLARNPETWHGTVVFVFQPGEETAAGARAMLDDWASYRTRFVKVMPVEYRRALREMEKMRTLIAAE